MTKTYNAFTLYLKKQCITKTQKKKYYIKKKKHRFRNCFNDNRGTQVLSILS